MERRKCIQRIVVFVAAFFIAAGMRSTVFAAAVRPTDVTVAEEGNVLLGVAGTYSSATKEQVLNRINEIRKEACEKGYPNPSTGEKLTGSDYVPIEWSSGLEWIAQLRAAECTVNESHTRPNGQSCFSISYGDEQSWAECLAWNYSGMLGGIEQWYGEKDDWVKQNTAAVTGHYTSLIAPSHRFIGLGAFRRDVGGWYGVAAEFSNTSIVGDLGGAQAGFTGKCIQMIEIEQSAVSSPAITGEKSVAAGSSTQLSLASEITFEGVLGGKKTTPGLIPGIVTWGSSDPRVATVSAAGNVEAKTVGKATITATSSEGVFASCTITVKAPAKGSKLKSGGITYKVTKAGATVEYCKATGSAKTVTIPSTVKISGIRYKITSIAKNAFKNNKKLANVTIGSNVEKIGDSAFRGCKNLKRITIKTKKLKTSAVKSNAFKGINSKAKIKVPSSKLKTYTAFLKKKGIGSKVKISK